MSSIKDLRAKWIEAANRFGDLVMDTSYDRVATSIARAQMESAEADYLAAQQADLIALEQEIYADLRRLSFPPEEVMAAMIDIESRQSQLAAYAVTWDATVAAMRHAVEGR
jgi:hypothetical protein